LNAEIRRAICALTANSATQASSKNGMSTRRHFLRAVEAAVSVVNPKEPSCSRGFETSKRLHGVYLAAASIKVTDAAENFYIPNQSPLGLVLGSFRPVPQNRRLTSKSEQQARVTKFDHVEDEQTPYRLGPECNC
jgi:hypothetical protein